jgi:hypothetical protein
MASELKLDESSDAVVVQGGIRATFNASGITVNVQGSTITIDKNGTVAMQTASNDSSGAAAPKAHQVGEHLKDGTVCIAVDLKNDNALFAPEGIFGSYECCDHQEEAVNRVNAGKGRHGHKDWRRITEAEGKTLSEVWDKVAPPALKGRAAPWFWLPGQSFVDDGMARKGGEADWDFLDKYFSLPVPVVRSGPAWS